MVLPVIFCDFEKEKKKRCLKRQIYTHTLQADICNKVVPASFSNKHLVKNTLRPPTEEWIISDSASIPVGAMFTAWQL